jgi:poly(A) polymerase
LAGGTEEDRFGWWILSGCVAVRETAVRIVRRLQQAGHEAGWVGGCVRDMLLGSAPKDYDVATSARPEAVQTLFPHTVAVGRQFGVMLVVEDARTYEVATFRTEGDYRDGRRPDRVEFADAQADMQRRDFTINGLFYDPLRDRLFDWVGGEADLRAGCVRTIGDPTERFAEDHLRLLRAVRFAIQLDFTIEPRTWQALRSMAAAIHGIAAERIREELLRLFVPPHAGRGLVLLEQSGLLAQLLPELQATVGCEQSPDYHPEGTVFQHLVRMLELLPTDAAPMLPWAVLLHDVGKPPTAARAEPGGRIRFHDHERVGAEMARTILERLRFQRRWIEEVMACVRFHMQFKDAPSMRKATRRRMMLRPTFDLELALHRLDCLGSHGDLRIHELLQTERAVLRRQPALQPPLLRGRDLIALGLAPGPRFTTILREAHERQLQDEIRTPDEALAWAARWLELERESGRHDDAGP